MSKQTHSSPSNRPVHTIRHRSLKASIWCNETEKGPMYNVTVVRSYVENGEWHDSTSYGYDDLMNVAKLMFDAHTFITDISGDREHLCWQKRHKWIRATFANYEQ